jgi:single-strand DNA-binding protein
MQRTSAKGNRWLALSVAVATGEERAEWISVSVFGDLLEAVPDDLTKGERLYVEGKLKVSRFTDKRSGEARANLQVSATRLLVLDRIGRRARRPRPRKTDDPGSSVIPLQMLSDDDVPDFNGAAAAITAPGSFPLPRLSRYWSSLRISGPEVVCDHAFCRLLPDQYRGALERQLQASCASHCLGQPSTRTLGHGKRAATHNEYPVAEFSTGSQSDS